MTIEGDKSSDAVKLHATFPGYRYSPPRPDKSHVLRRLAYIPRWDLCKTCKVSNSKPQPASTQWVAPSVIVARALYLRNNFDLPTQLVLTWLFQYLDLLTHLLSLIHLSLCGHLLI